MSIFGGTLGQILAATQRPASELARYYAAQQARIFPFALQLQAGGTAPIAAALSQVGRSIFEAAQMKPQVARIEEAAKQRGLQALASFAQQAEQLRSNLAQERLRSRALDIQQQLGERALDIRERLADLDARRVDLAFERFGFEKEVTGKRLGLEERRVGALERGVEADIYDTLTRSALSLARFEREGEMIPLTKKEIEARIENYKAEAERARAQAEAAKDDPRRRMWEYEARQRETDYKEMLNVQRSREFIKKTLGYSDIDLDAAAKNGYLHYLARAAELKAQQQGADIGAPPGGKDVDSVVADLLGKPSTQITAQDILNAVAQMQRETFERSLRRPQPSGAGTNAQTAITLTHQKIVQEVNAAMQNPSEADTHYENIATLLAQMRDQIKVQLPSITSNAEKRDLIGSTLMTLISARVPRAYIENYIRDTFNMPDYKLPAEIEEHPDFSRGLFGALVKREPGAILKVARHVGLWEPGMKEQQIEQRLLGAVQSQMLSSDQAEQLIDALAAKGHISKQKAEELKERIQRGGLLSAIMRMFRSSGEAAFGATQAGITPGLP